MKKILYGIIMVFLAASLSAETKFVINRGHFSPIVSIRYDQSRDLIFSAEEKGAVSVWNRADESLRNHFQLTSNTIDQILISPSETNIAVLSHDAEKYYLSVWDWTMEKKIFTRTIDEQPLFLEYSATGKYLFYGNVKNPSLTFLNARNGVQLNYMNQLPSIYDFGFLGTSEKTLMTYSSSGSIRFYDFRTSEDKLNVPTEGGLTDLNVISSNNGYFSAMKGNRIFLIDRLKGLSVDTEQFHELNNFYQNRDNGHALTLDRSNRNFVLKKWSTEGNSFKEIAAAISLPVTFKITSLVEAGDLTLAGDEDGSLYKADWTSSRLVPFSIDNTKEISDLSISGDTLTLCGDDGLVSIRAPFFSGTLSTTASPVFAREANPISGEVGIRKLDDGTTLLWTRGSDAARIVITGEDNKVLFEYSKFNSPLQDIAYEEGKIITLEKNGTITIIDRATGASLFSYTAIGLQDISLVNNRTLFAGRSSTGDKSPGITIDLKTRETLTVQDDRFLIFDSMAVETSHQFYSLGLLKEDGKIKTILRSHNYEDLNQSETILIYTGEDINAQVLVDPDGSKTIYAKLGSSGLYKISGRNVTKYDNNKPVRRIYLSGSILYSLNEDNSITLFRASTGKQLYSIYVFKDDSWALIPSSSDIYFGSDGVEKDIISYRNNRRIDLKPVNGGR